MKHTTGSGEAAGGAKQDRRGTSGSSCASSERAHKTPRGRVCHDSLAPPACSLALLHAGGFLTCIYRCVDALLCLLVQACAHQHVDMVQSDLSVPIVTYTYVHINTLTHSHTLSHTHRYVIERSGGGGGVGRGGCGRCGGSKCGGQRFSVAPPPRYLRRHCTCLSCGLSVNIQTCACIHVYTHILSRAHCLSVSLSRTHTHTRIHGPLCSGIPTVVAASTAAELAGLEWVRAL